MIYNKMENEDLQKYVKLNGPGGVHTVLFTIADICNRASEETRNLKRLEKEKYKIFAEARSTGRHLLSDLKELNNHLGEPKGFNIPRAKVVVHKKKVTASKKVKKSHKPIVKKKVIVKAKSHNAKRTTAKPKPRIQKDTENLKRLKANLDAIRASLK